MRCRLFRLLSVASLLLCLAGIVLWVDSMWHLDAVGSSFGTSRLMFVAVQRGTFWLGYENVREPWSVAVRKDVDSLHPARSSLGFGFLNDSMDTGIGIPVWLLLPMLVVSSLLFRRAGRRIPGPGFCKCGYDLTGNISGICPECGTAVLKRAEVRR